MERFSLLAPALSLWSEKPIDNSSIVIVTSAVLVIASVYFLYQTGGPFSDRPYPDMPLIGKDPGESIAQAKARWLTSARQIISSGLAQINGPFQVMATVRPMIILPARYIEEIKNHASFNFAKAVESNFYGRYPGFDGLSSLNQNEVFQDAIKVRLTQSLRTSQLHPCMNTYTDMHIYIFAKEEKNKGRKREER